MLRTLGLDLGTNSIGWALVSEDSEARAGVMEDCGVRIFEEAVDAKTRTPKNAARRAARLARRVLQRRARRRQLLREQLAEAGLLPPDLPDAGELERKLNALGDPYDLRKRALDERLEPHEIGRVLLHLCARRGFQSNRKTRWGDLLGDRDAHDLIQEAEERQRKEKEGRSDRAKEEEREQGKVIAEVADLWNEMKAKGARTLGEYLAGLPKGGRKRNRYTDRRMYQDEFEAVWNAQAAHHPMLDDGLKARFRHTIFDQRALNLDGGRIGMCSLEPKRPRAAKARLESQRFRLLQDVNHLEVAGIFSDDYTIEPGQRQNLADALEMQQFMTWGSVRKLLGFPGRVKFNLEEGSKDKGLPGNRTAVRLRKIIPAQWDDWDGAKRKRLVEDLLTIADKCALFCRLREHWGFERKTAFNLAVEELEDGHLNHSVKAMSKMLPYLEQGMRYSDARIKAGYVYARDDLPEARDFLGAPPKDLRNPVVEKALHELRKVVNAVVRRHGKPDVIRVELARDLRMSRKDKARFERQQKQNQRMNEEARTKLAEIQMTQISRGDLIKYRLWKESGGECPYTGKTISLHELFSSDVEVEHIIPYSQCLDDSFLNKTLCMTWKNREKGNRTPFEAFGSTPEWCAMRQRVKKLDRRKLTKFTQEEVPELDTFVNRQLTDTGYISRAALDYLRKLGVDVQVSNGRATGMLRHLWGLNRILAGDSPDAEAVAEKNRSDHRHHALDAAVVAVTGRSTYQRIARIARQNEESGLDPIRGSAVIDPPWDGFDREVEHALESIAVSHAPRRKLAGALHEDTAFGFRYVPGEGEKRFVYRKPLEALTGAMIGKIVDPVLRQAVEERVAQEGSVKAAFQGKEFLHPKNPNGQPVRRVRIYENKSVEQLFAVEGQTDRSGGPFKYHAYGNNHHVEIFRNARTGRVEARFVTMMEAAKRARRDKSPIIDREKDDCEFLMSLCINDMVELDGGGLDNLYRVQILDADGKRLVLRHHRAATLEDKSEQVRVAVSKLVDERRMRKVNVTPLGEIEHADD